MHSLLHRLAMVVFLPLAMAACTDDNNDGNRQGSAATGGPTLTGAVVGGITANAVVTVLDPDGILLATTMSNAQGAYSVNLPLGYTGAVQIVITASAPPDAPTQMRCDAPAGCRGADSNLVANGEWFNVPTSFEMRAVASVTGTGIRLINVTPLSTLAAKWAVTFPQGLDGRSADAANDQVAAMFGLALADTEKPLSDVNDLMWLKLADAQQIQLSLLCATFAEIAEQNHMTMQDVMDTLSMIFNAEQGRLLEDSADGGPSIYYLLTVSTTIAGTLTVPDNTSWGEANAAVQVLLGRLEKGKLSAHAEVSYDDFIAKLGPLGVQLDADLETMGLKDPRQFILDKAPYFSWLLAPENLQLVTLALHTVGFALEGALALDVLPPETTSYVLPDSNGMATLDVTNKQLTIVGNIDGQVANFTLDLTGLLSGLNAGHFSYGIDGTAVNDTASGEIHGTLGIDTSRTNMTSLITAINALKAQDPNAGLYLQLALYSLAQTLDVSVTLQGNAQLVNNVDTDMVLGGEVALTASLDLGSQAGEPIAALTVTSGDLVLPDGGHLYGLEGKPILDLQIGDNATLTIDGAAVVLNLPEAIAHAEGELTNSRLLFNHIRDTVFAAVSGGSADLSSLISELLDFDFSQMSLHGTGSIEIPSLDHEYRAALDNLKVTFYQPHSEDVAATAELMWDEQKVHIMLGDEPWDLRMLVSPTPRLLLLGPDGQYAEASQEDVFEFLSGLPLGSLLGGLWPSAPAT